MSQGYILLHRQIRNNKIWEEKPFSKGQAWIDLMMLASHNGKTIWKRGIEIELKRGQVGVSIKGLADVWGWSRSKVTRFLKYLENEHQIEHQIDNITTIITINNYNKYQDANTKTNTKRTPNEHQTNTTKECIKNEEIINKEKIPPDFADVVEYYREKGFSETHANNFYSYYDSIGWTTGKANKPLKKWRAAASGNISRFELIPDLPYHEVVQCPDCNKKYKPKINGMKAKCPDCDVECKLIEKRYYKKGE